MGLSQKSVRAGALQWDVCLGDTEKNIRRCGRGIREAASDGVELLVLPEMWASGFDYTGLSDHAASTPGLIKDLQALALENKMVIAGSLPTLSSTGHIANTLFVIDADGGVAGRYDKMHLFTPTGEHRHFTSGSRPVICDTAVGTLGLMICYDLRFPELARHMVLSGADILIVSAQWPDARIHHWEILLQARAIENQVFVIASNRCGKDHDLVYGGASMIVSPSGEILCHGEKYTGLISATLDGEVQGAIKGAIPCLTHVKENTYTISPRS